MACERKLNFKDIPWQWQFSSVVINFRIAIGVEISQSIKAQWLFLEILIERQSNLIHRPLQFCGDMFLCCMTVLVKSLQSLFGGLDTARHMIRKYPAVRQIFSKLENNLSFPRCGELRSCPTEIGRIKDRNERHLVFRV